ncbi:MAG: AmmeMemoRadiSam system protein A [Candidatus Methylomirabilota bacterium]
MTDSSTLLTPRQQTALLALARHAIRERVRGTVGVSPLPHDPVFQQPGAPFVTLTKEGALRGCIGFIQATQPLAEAVRHCAMAAAVSDPRFPPVRPEELPLLRVEISLLSPLRRVENLDTIRVGIHGLLVSQGGRRGLLLPQVATEYGWDRDAFLSHTCLKAGLPEDAWRRGAEIHAFTVLLMSDDRPVEEPTR